ncbi:MAG: CPXCG motif-containing cysteine-rich protein [Magnetococcales bacterium]|nr:CPXCG motif-containing cysteine-rich protein [Magnetococcales bacterium]
MLEPVLIYCPYCGEAIVTQADCSAGNQEYIEDCQVCCRPIIMTLEVDEDGRLIALDTRREDE